MRFCEHKIETCEDCEAALLNEIEIHKHCYKQLDERREELWKENAKLRSLVNRLAEKLRLIRHYDSGSHSPETVEDIIAEAGREIA